jgi:hypothetical protein
MIRYFTLQEQWKRFTDKYTGNKAFEAVTADEAIWPFIIAAFTKLTQLPLLVVAATRERVFQLWKEIGCLTDEAVISVFPGTGSGIFLRNKIPDQRSMASRLNTLKKSQKLRQKAADRHSYFQLPDKPYPRFQDKQPGYP